MSELIPETVFALFNKIFKKKEFYKKSLESNADFKTTCCENILSNLYSLMCIVCIYQFQPEEESTC